MLLLCLYNQCTLQLSYLSVTCRNLTSYSAYFSLVLLLHVFDLSLKLLQNFTSTCRIFCTWNFGSALTTFKSLLWLRLNHFHLILGQCDHLFLLILSYFWTDLYLFVPHKTSCLSGLLLILLYMKNFLGLLLKRVNFLLFHLNLCLISL